ncbi:MAG: HDOD domain-containing protein [Ignavibacteriaceae bacterium]
MKILFVDDEPNIIMGLKRMLHQMRNEWEMFFAESGTEALNILDKSNIDIIVTDMRMPQMDGAQLLSIVKEKYPGVVRIILSGYSEKEYIMKTSSSAHQFLAKPCRLDELKSTIRRLTNLRTLVLSDDIKKKITGLSNLPSLPILYKQLDRELKSSNISIKKIGDIISQDITMTAKILQMVNSAFFGIPQKINDPVQAVNFLGMDTIKSLVLFHHLFSTFEKIESMQTYLEEIWNHSLNVATRAKKIMEYRKQDHNCLEQTFAAGLLHDIGKLILIQSPEYQAQIIKLNKTSDKELRKYEIEFFGADHSLIGGYLLGLWGLPDYVIESTAFHHSPIAIGDENFSILSAIYLADINTLEEDYDKDYIELICTQEELNTYFEILKNTEGLTYA